MRIKKQRRFRLAKYCLWFLQSDARGVGGKDPTSAPPGDGFRMKPSYPCTMAERRSVGSAWINSRVDKMLLSLIRPIDAANHVAEPRHCGWTPGYCSLIRVSRMRTQLPGRRLV